MKDCAIAKNGNDIVKITNLPRKYDKIINNPNIEILEECSKDDVERLYSIYIDKQKLKEEAENNKRNIVLYHFHNDKTGETITSIYSQIDNIVNPEELGDWYQVD